MAEDITGVIVPNFSNDNINYRIPDSNTTPSLSTKDYFYTPETKNFIFKTESQRTFVEIDFWGFDNSFFNGKTFTTV
jgi:hypothetical protein